MILGSISISAQSKYFTRNANVVFDASGPLEEISANNSKVSSVIDANTGKIEFAVLIKSFVFDKALMQEHFNENYLESDKYPKSTFKGTITNISDISLSKKGTYTAKVTGKMTIHGVTKEVVATGPITVNGKSINLNATFNIKLSDYNIKVPALVKDKLSNEVKITVSGNYNAM